MARYKAIDTSPRFLAVDLEKQLLPGSFEHAVHYLLEHEFDLSLFDGRYRNDQNGASAYPPGMLLKVILCVYAQRRRQQSGHRAPVPRTRHLHRPLWRQRTALHHAGRLRFQP